MTDGKSRLLALASIPSALGPAASDEDLRAAKRLCFFAHYHPDGIVSDAVLFHLEALAKAGFAVVVLSTATLDGAEQSRLAAACARLIIRANEGLDFGGWQEAVACFFPIAADLLLLANDSVYGPLEDLSAFVETLTAEPADFYGAVETNQFGAHLQSWFVLLRPAAYRSIAFARMMGDRIAPGLDKWDIITRYEVGMTAALVEEGLTYHAAYRPETNGLIAGEVFFTPTQPLWRELIVGGIPFVKIEALRDRPLPAGRVDDWPWRLGAAPPVLVEAIRQDLARRRKRSPVAIRRAQLGTAKGVATALYWAIVRGFLRRDYRRDGAAGRSQRLNAAVFRLLLGLKRKATSRHLVGRDGHTGTSA